MKSPLGFYFRLLASVEMPVFIFGGLIILCVGLAVPITLAVLHQFAWLVAFCVIYPIIALHLFALFQNWEGIFKHLAHEADRKYQLIMESKVYKKDEGTQLESFLVEEKILPRRVIE